MKFPAKGRLTPNQRLLQSDGLGAGEAMLRSVADQLNQSGRFPDLTWHAVLDNGDVTMTPQDIMQSSSDSTMADPGQTVLARVRGWSQSSKAGISLGEVLTGFLAVVVDKIPDYTGTESQG